jgi:hypothetical protein
LYASTGVSGSNDPAFAGLQLLNTKEKIQMETLTVSGGDPFMHGPIYKEVRTRSHES